MDGESEKDPGTGDGLPPSPVVVSDHSKTFLQERKNKSNIKIKRYCLYNKPALISIKLETLVVKSLKNNTEKNKQRKAKSFKHLRPLIVTTKSRR